MVIFWIEWESTGVFFMQRRLHRDAGPPEIAVQTGVIQATDGRKGLVRHLFTQASE